MNILDKSNKNDHSSSAIDENQNFDDKNNHQSSEKSINYLSK